MKFISKNRRQKSQFNVGPRNLAEGAPDVRETKESASHHCWSARIPFGSPPGHRADDREQCFAHVFEQMDRYRSSQRLPDTP